MKRSSLFLVLSLLIASAHIAPANAAEEPLLMMQAVKKATPKPTATPKATPAPTKAPTKAPTATPKATAAPTKAPTKAPTATPKATPVPTKAPTKAPTATPVPTKAPTKAPTATPKATPVPTKAPTATPKPTVKPTETPYEWITPVPPKIIIPNLPTTPPMVTKAPTPSVTPEPTPTQTVVPTKTPSPVPTATPIPFRVTIVQVGDTFVDVNVQGAEETYSVWIDGIYTQDVMRGISRIDGLWTNETITLRIENRWSNERFQQSILTKRELYESRAFFHQISPQDFRDFTYVYSDNVDQLYRQHTDVALDQLRTIGVAPREVQNRSQAFVFIDQFEPDVSCAAYAQVAGWAAPNIPSAMNVVYNPVEMGRSAYTNARRNKVAVHEFGHVMGLEHQNDGNLKTDSNIEASVMRQGFIPWTSEFQTVDRYNLNWQYSSLNAVATRQTAAVHNMHADVTMMDFQELLDSSDAVVLAKPLSSVARPTQLVTETTLQVERVLKGESPAFVYEPYFMQNGTMTTIESYRPMRNGESYLLFLRKHKTKGTYMVNGIQQGQFSFTYLDAASVNSPYPQYPKLKSDAMQWLKGQSQ